MTVEYAAPVAAGGRMPVVTVCTPPSGSTFEVGTSAVDCEASDSAAQRASCRFDVIVRPRPPAPRLALTRFLAFGDSVTQGVTSVAPLRVAALSYPDTLQALLSERYADQEVTVVNAGLAGEMAMDGAVRLRQVLPTVHPDALLLLEGVNDLYGYGDSGLRPAASAIDGMIRYAQGEGVRVYVATLLPERAGSSHAAPGELLAAFNARLRETADRLGADLVDLNTLVDLSLIGVDGVHPTEAGQKRIGEIFFEAIRGTLELPATEASAARRQAPVLRATGQPAGQLLGGVRSSSHVERASPMVAQGLPCWRRGRTQSYRPAVG